jgi:hypothetical protein
MKAGRRRGLTARVGRQRWRLWNLQMAAVFGGGGGHKVVGHVGEGDGGFGGHVWRLLCGSREEREREDWGRGGVSDWAHAKREGKGVGSGARARVSVTPHVSNPYD